MASIYLDNNATTRVDPAVVEEMLPYFTEHFGNPASTHSFGTQAAEGVRRARSNVQALLGADYSNEIMFTSGGTESNTTAIWSALRARPRCREIVTSEVEHPAVLALCDYLETRENYRVHRVQVDHHGHLNMAFFAAALSERVAIATIMTANNETGTIFPVEELASLAHDAGVLFHTDAVQPVGKRSLDLKSTAIDLLSLSGHKLHGPKGVGALYVRRGTRFRPLLHGGGQEGDRRGGTENVPGIVGLGKAAELALVQLVDGGTRIATLRDRLESAILTQVPNCFVVGDSNARIPNTTNIIFDSLDNGVIVRMLSEDSIFVSSGSACSSMSAEPSHVLRAMQIPANTAHGAVRFSLSRDTTDAEISVVINPVRGVVNRLRGSRNH